MQFLIASVRQCNTTHTRPDTLPRYLLSGDALPFPAAAAGVNRRSDTSSPPAALSGR
ncbi:LEPR-XLL domain-containing protein [Enterobacter huaxiensis]|uniref:LEPR-XLL domain-containing protein n=1 Tax=Enterobacter huaxiensis TaxID=2494702 RepID=UPI0035AB6EC0